MDLGEFSRPTVVLFVLGTLLKEVSGADYCRKECTDYYPGPQYSDCVAFQNSEPSCGIDRIGLIIIAPIVLLIFVLVICACCVRNARRGPTTGGMVRNNGVSFLSESSVVVPPRYYANNNGFHGNHTQWGPTAPCFTVLQVEDRPPSYKSAIATSSAFKKGPIVS